MATTSLSAAKIYRIYGHHPPDELPIFGSSRAQTGFDPEILGQKSFNYGIDASLQSETLDLVETYLKYTEHNATNHVFIPIIINLDPWGFPEEEVSAKFQGDYSLVNGAWLGMRSFGKFRKTFTSWLNERTSGTKRIICGAVMPRISRTSAEWKVINSNLGPKRFYVSGYWKNRITRLSKLTRRPICWVVGPCESYWMSLFENPEDLDAFCDWISTLPNQKAVNLYAIGYGANMFMDPTHLNDEGASMFTQELVLRLSEFGIVKR